MKVGLLFRALGICMAAFYAFACDDDDADKTDDDNNEEETAEDPFDGDLSGTGPYAIISYIGENMSAFADVIGSLDGGGTYAAKNAHEVEGGFLFNYNGRIFSPPEYGGGGTEIEIFTVDKDNTLSKEEEGMPVPADASPSGFLFIDDENAYMSLSESGAVWAFNPTTLEKSAEIDLQAYAVGSDEDASDDTSPDPSNLVVKDGKLHVALCQSYNSMTMARPGMYVAVIDMENNEVEQIISDTERGFAMAGNIHSCDGAAFLDENGDLYVMAMGSWGWVEGQKAGYLRIKAGETKFDPDWELDFSTFNVDVTGGVIDYLHYATYAGNGIVYGSAHVPGDESNPVNWVKDKCYSYVKVDIWNNTVEALPLPPTGAYGSDMVMDGDLMIAPMYTDEGTGIYVYDTVSGEVSCGPVLWTEGVVGFITSAD